MEKITLNDGEKQIKNISILGLFRDCSDYFEYFTKVMIDMENMYNVTFDYFFCENDSKDDTRDKLKKFAKGRQCKLLLLQLEKDYSTNDLAINLERIHTLLTLRNKLKDTFGPFKSDWTMIVDTGIYFRPTILHDMFNYKKNDENIGAMCPYVVQIYSKEKIIDRPEFQHLRQHLQNVKSPTDLINLEHFYDTYSTIDNNSIFMYPFCPFEKCLLCKPARSQFDYKLIPADKPIVEVNSTFGGFCLIDTNIFNNKSVRWDTICLNMVKHTSICEHILFCDRIRTVSGKKVVILQDIKNVFRTS
jgi:hypothetical protein